MTTRRRLHLARCSLFPMLVALAAFAVSWRVQAENQDRQVPLESKNGSKESSRSLPLGLEDAGYFVPENNPMTPAKIELGRLLFFDKRLSIDNSVACATCHSPGNGFSDGLRVSSGIQGRQGVRNAPTIINRFSRSRQFWDGRAATLEEQAKGPLINPLEMGMPDSVAVTDKVASIEGYRKLFQEVFERKVEIDDIVKSIASFERTIVSGNSGWDRFNAGDETALTSAARRGLAVFEGKGRCNQCHSGWNLTDEKFHNIGIGWDLGEVDKGRFAVTGNEQHTGAFKTPTLREIASTAPYMHDGRFDKLEEVVGYYNEGVISNPFLDVEMARPALSLLENMERYAPGSQSGQKVSLPVKKLGLAKGEKVDLVAFLRSLDGEWWQHVLEPSVFPE